MLHTHTCTHIVFPYSYIFYVNGHHHDFKMLHLNDILLKFGWVASYVCMHMWACEHVDVRVCERACMHDAHQAAATKASHECSFSTT